MLNSDKPLDQGKHQSSASLAYVRGIHRWPVNFLHKGPVMWKMFPFDEVDMSLAHICTGIILCMSPGKERRCYNVCRFSLAGRIHKMIPVCINGYCTSYLPSKCWSHIYILYIYMEPKFGFHSACQCPVRSSEILTHIQILKFKKRHKDQFLWSLWRILWTVFEIITL